MTRADLDGLAVVVTGGGAGIGIAVASAAAARGARVAVLDLDPAGVPDGVAGLRADVTDEDSVRRAVDEAADRLGGIDVLVNNAGIGAQGSVEDNPLEEWRRSWTSTSTASCG